MIFYSRFILSVDQREHKSTDLLIEKLNEQYSKVPNNSIYEISLDALNAANALSYKLGDFSSVVIIDYGYDLSYPWKNTLRVIFKFFLG